MKKKNGFTLVELLGVIILIAVVALLIMPIVNNIITDSREKAYNEQINRVIESAKKWMLQHGSELSNQSFYLNGEHVLCGDMECSIPVNTLIQGGYMQNDELTDPRNKDTSLTGCVNISYLDSYNQYEYNYGDCILSGVARSLIANRVTEGDGLYFDEIDNTYRYKGSNPNNYIRIFEGAYGLYRIIAVENQGVKVVSNLSFEKEWDIGNVQTTSCASNNCPRYDSTNATNTYCHPAGNTYYGCNAWNINLNSYTNCIKTGSVNADSSILTYLQGTYYANNVNVINDSIVLNATWNIGGVSNGNIEDLLDNENNITWSGKIGLINPSDYVRSQLPLSSSACLEETYNVVECKNNNWLLDKTNNQWTMNSVVDDTTKVFYINTLGSTNSDYVYNNKFIKPVVYLKSDILITSGSGAFNDPFIIN